MARILVIDHDDKVFDEVAESLLIDSHEVYRCTGDYGKCCSEYEPDLVLVDIELGFDSDDIDSDPNVAIMSTYEAADRIDSAVSSTAIDYIIKPIHPGLIRHRVRAILHSLAQRKALEDALRMAQAIIKAFPDSLWTVSSSGVILDYCAGGDPDCIFCGSDIVGKNIRDVMPRSVYLQAMDAVDRVLLGSSEYEQFDVLVGKSVFDMRVVAVGDGTALITARYIVPHIHKTSIEQAVDKVDEINKLIGEVQALATDLWEKGGNRHAKAI